MYPKHYKHRLYTLAYTIDCVLFSLFAPKKVHLKAKIDSFLTFMLIDSSVQTLEYVGNLNNCICFANKNMKETKTSKIPYQN